MPKLPRITGDRIVKALLRAGFEIARQRGSHIQIRKFVKDPISGQIIKVTFPVPVHRGKILKPGTLHGILRKANLTIEDLEKLL